MNVNQLNSGTLVVFGHFGRRPRSVQKSIRPISELPWYDKRTCAATWALGENIHAARW
jgi:hypothetical protein